MSLEYRSKWHGTLQNRARASQGPRCSIRSKNIYSDANPDYLKMTLLNLPAAVLVRGSAILVIASILSR